MTKSKDFLEKATDRLASRVQKDVEALRREGLEPAARDGQIFGGVPPVASFTVREVDDDRLEVRLLLRAGEGRADVDLIAWGEQWPRAGTRVRASELLSALTSAWPAVAGPYLPREAGRSSVTLSVAGLSSLGLRWIDDGLLIESGDRVVEMVRDSVLVVEVLRCFGDAVAGICRKAGRDGIASSWFDVSSVTDLPPMSFGHFESDGEDIGPETEWYAARFEMDATAYRMGAMETSVRQAEFATGSSGLEPSREDWHPGRGSTIPDAELLARAASVAARLGQDLDDFCDGAVRQRNFDARQITVFQRNTSSEGATPRPAP